MKISLNWLKRYVELNETPSELSDTLTLLGFEVDDMEQRGVPEMEHVRVGEILDRQQHPNADRLGVCRVNLGAEIGEKVIVCGATNYKVGDRVPVALPGAELPGGFKIKRSALRGVESDGMMCSGKELGISQDGEGLMILDGEPELGALLHEAMDDADTIFNIEVTPNRPDCLNHLGIARELAAWYDRELTYPEADDIPLLEDRANGESVFQGVAVDCEEDCPLYHAAVIKGVKIGPSPSWLKKALASVGLRSINNVVDVTNFVMLECGNPMHAFDARDINGKKIRVRNAFDGEPMTTLDGIERKLSKRMVVIADSERPLAIAGVMGGLNSEVKADTTDLVLEVAYFKPTTIRWVSKNLALSTDSSYRFERGIDPHSLSFAVDRAVSLILQTAGGELCQNAFVVGSTPAWESEVQIIPDWIRQKAGFEITDDEIRSSLERLELEVREGDESWTIVIPSHRGDLDRPIDILEEVLRLYGTHRIPSGKVVATAMTRNDHPMTLFARSASSYLVGQHFQEAVTYTLRSMAEQKLWASNVAAKELALANPISEDQTQLRHSLVPGLLEVLRLNQSRKTGATRFFETGRTFQEVGGKVCELFSVAFIDSSLRLGKSWKVRESEDFYVAKNRIESIAKLAGFDLGKFALTPITVNTSAWQEGHSAEVSEPKAGIYARIGLMNLARIKEMDIQGEVIAGIFSVLTERLREPKRPKFQPVSLFPSSTRDLALVVAKEELAASVVTTVRKIAEKATDGKFQIENVSVFDVYEGTGVPEGKKSIAVSIVYRSQDRTLTDKEVNTAFELAQKEIRASGTIGIRE